MCNLSQGIEARGRVKGIEEGRAEGRAIGRTEGETLLGILMIKLKELGRIDDAFRATSDPAFRAEMYKEFQLA